jgi:hypothetical protein
MAVTRKDYNELAVQAAHTVLLELSRILGQYRDNMVIIGGWVPTLLFTDAPEKHVGSMDVDIAFDHAAITEPGYRTILDLLKRHNYREGDQPFVFYRTFDLEGESVTVEVDLLAGEYKGTGKKHRTQRIQDVKVRKARGCDLAFDGPGEITVKGTLPGGAQDQALVRVTAIVPFLVMKGMALADRIKEKDAYDIYYCVKYFPGGIEKLKEEFRPLLKNKLVKEGLRKIEGKFKSPEQFGPKSVADFNEITDAEERARVQRDAFERVDAFLKAVDVR